MAKPTGIVTVSISGDEKDVENLPSQHHDERQTLKRRFGLWSMVGLTCSLMLTWEGTIIFFIFGLPNGGPAGLIYGYLVVWLGWLSVFIALGELASMMPHAGGQYHWAGIMAPDRYRKAISYVTGWINVISWIVSPTGAAVFAAGLLQNLVALNHPKYHPTSWQGTLIMYAYLIVCLILNTVVGPHLPKIEIFILVLHIVGFFAFLIPMVSLSSFSGPKMIFTSFWNLGEWPTTALAFFVGLQGNVGGFLGTDGAIHMAEEVIDSQRNVPKAMIIATVLNGALGFIMMIVFLLSADNLLAILQSGSQFPFVEILAEGLGSNTGANILVSLLLVMYICGITSAISAASRMLYSFARERAMPGWSWLQHLDRRHSIPFRTVTLVAVFGFLLFLINIGSSSILNDVLSLFLEGSFSSFFISLSLLLYRRLRGDIKEPSELKQSTPQDESHDASFMLKWGPWRLPGWVGIANNIVALCFCTLIIFFGFWPSMARVDASNMNYSIVMLGGLSILALLYYFGWARKQYVGPSFKSQ